jgi:beta-fructofuranosidase
MTFRPLHHICAKKGWINDPNGLIKFKGKYHIFFQHHPYSNEWGPMHWGHVVSEDLIHYEHLPHALTPGDKMDRDGCFSGSSIVVEDTLYLVYTGFILDKENESNNRQIQCLAFSKDGVNFTKHGVIIDSNQLPDEFLKTDFRDPSIFKENDTYYLLAASKRKTGGGAILLYKSKDLYNWEFVNDILTHNSEGKMIECPDYVKDLDLLLYCEQDFPLESTHCFNIHSTEYVLGKFDESYKFQESNKKTLVDYGFDYYAPQVIKDGNIMIAWLNMWDRNNPSSVDDFAGQLSVPRKIRIEEGLLLQEPIIYGTKTRELNIKEIVEGNILVGTIKLDVEELKSLNFELRVGENEKTLFYLKDDEFYFDRSSSGIQLSGAEKDELSLKGIRKMPYRKAKKTEICLVFDRNSIEIFVNGISSSNVIYPSETSDKYTLKIISKSARFIEYKCE